MTLLSGFKSSTKKWIVRSLAILAVIAGVTAPLSISSSQATNSYTPRFNFLNGDEEMLTAANYTKAQSNWADPVTGNYAAAAGDEIVFRFYFHNGMLDTTAHNVILKAQMSDSVNAQQKVYTSLSSDETAPITDTVIDGQIKGYGSGFAQIDLTAPGRIEYVPGSTKMWRQNPNQWGTQLPDGIASANGLNIGNINGCWDYAGFVTFRAKIMSPAQIVLNKYVSQTNSINWQKSLSDRLENEIVIWKVALSNNGQTVANNIQISDMLPAKLTYVSGSTLYYGPGSTQGTPVADGITTNGLNLASLNPGADNAVYYTFRTKIGTNLNYGPNGISELINTAAATFAGVTLRDQAKVLVGGSSGLTIDKKVWNGTSWVEQNYIKLGNNIRYQITFRNTGQLDISGLRVWDIIPVYTEYVAGSTKINGVAAQDGVASGGINLGTLARGCSVTVEFVVKTYGCPPVGDYNLVNTAYGVATNINQISDTASTIMSLNPISGPGVGGL